MNEKYMAAYVSTVSAIEMFRAITTIPLHQSFSGYDPIDRIQSVNLTITLEEMQQLREIGVAREIIMAAAHMGERMGRKLAQAFDSEDLDGLKTNEVLQKYIYELAQLLPKEERVTMGNFLTR
ncbi:hypothetical protein ACXWTF_12640 [Thiomicrolovo sp. ZZH C-3]